MSMAKASKFWNYNFFSENNRPLLIHPFQLESLVQGLLLSVHLIVDSGLAWHSSFNVEAILKIPIPFIRVLTPQPALAKIHVAYREPLTVFFFFLIFTTEELLNL